MPARNLLDRIADRLPAEAKSFSEPPFWALEAARYSMWGSSTSEHERIENDYEGYVLGALKGSGVVFSCIQRRWQVFSQARFLWRRFLDGRPQDLFGSAELDLLEHPWPNGTTGELLTLAEIDASLAGNFYATTCSASGKLGNASRGLAGRRIVRMRPDWTTLVLDAPSGDLYGLDVRVVAALYEPRSMVGGTTHDAVTLLPSEFVHYSPIPDPMARYRGMSWLTPILREIEADIATTIHKAKFFENGATPAMVVKGIKATTPGQFDEIVDAMEDKHRGSTNAFKTLYLTEGADATPMGFNLKDMDFKAIQGAGEVRVATAAGVPSVILGNTEGLAGSSLNQGNFAAARRLFADTTITDLWNKVAPSFQTFVVPPGNGAELWYDFRDIPFLREDAKDDAEIRAANASALRQLLDAGYEPDAAVEYMKTGDLNRLKGKHSGLFSVQLQPPMPDGPPAPVVVPSTRADAPPALPPAKPPKPPKSPAGG
jgi:hypothetical protein